ncbi:peroxisomal membrane protein PEX14 [Chenopodium quinoa]|uniref:peroxisomal membrane protein PEX14 n=1 Tax=Chenopodium quinoa TaxID=63459 RepID=UPI000B79AE49|nr:peroxisomal membrane protein PEX14 [Chenopodium quinoa]XP_021733633.1 peroxisomal membrane protein PEX14 [Chenopodium quinoa]
MASEAPPSNPSDNNPSNPAPEPAQSVENKPPATPELPAENSPKSVFVNSQPIREDQVRNAINFLSHPRVKGSPVIHRRNFLEKKGLTKEEIDEAFRRVPDPSPAVASGQSSTNQVAQPTPATNIQAQVPLQAVQSVAPVQSGVMSTMARRFHWSHAVLAVGFLAISGAGTAIVFKNSLIPRLKSWIRGVVMDEDSHEEETDKKPSLAEEATAAAKAAAAAAADVAKASQELVISKNEEKERFADFMSLLEVQVQELRSMRSEMTRLEGKSHSGVRSNVREGYLDGSKARSVQPMGRNSEFDMRSVRSVSPPASAEPPHPKSYGEIMAMVQRGERPPNVREIDDQPPNPNQPISNPNLAPRAKPWEGGLPPNYENPAPWYDSWWKQKDRMAESRKMEDSNPVHERRWVPPQPPSVSMPEAAAAIRQAKSIPKDFNLGADKAPQPVEGLDELQRVTQLSETVGKLDLNVEGERSETFSSEIQEEQEEEQVTEM